jgi:molybdate transport system substrate-binding protein
VDSYVHPDSARRGATFRLSIYVLLVSLTASTACRQPSSQTSGPGAEEITVAAAANLSDSFPELAFEFTKQTGIKVVLSFGATADLAKQIENSAPFDVFASADVIHVSSLDQKGLITNGTMSRYARGSLVIWIPDGSKVTVKRLEDIADSSIERIAIAKPDIAPYGAAAVEALRALKLWEKVEPRVVYGMNVSQVRQFVSSGNAEVGFLPRSLVQNGKGTFVEVDEKLHQPIDQALGVVKASPKQEAARSFTSFVLSPEGQKILQQHGYLTAAGSKQ